MRTWGIIRQPVQHSSAQRKGAHYALCAGHGCPRRLPSSFQNGSVRDCAHFVNSLRCSSVIGNRLIPSHDYQTDKR